MPPNHPPSPQSPSQTYDTHGLPPKPKTASPGISSSLPTPAHSINGSMSSTGSGFVTDGADGANKRKRDLEDHGDRDQKKVHVEESRISVDDLHLDVGDKYLLCRTPHPPREVPMSQDLFQLYGLSDLAETVARQYPDGSKKIVRKTYKGFISKIFKLQGNFDVQKKELDSPDTLFSMLSQPADVWDSQYGGSVGDLSGGLPEEATKSLKSAMTMSRGTLPKDVWNQKVLGELGKEHSPTEPPKSAQSAQSGARTPIQQHAGNQRPVKGELPRPKRNVKQRTYGDASFEGYGEGFVDDEMADQGYSTGGDADDRNPRKKQKKFAGNIAQASIARQNSYGPGSIGV